MTYNNICKICDRIIISTAVNYDATTNELIIGIPSGTYYNNERYFLIIAQNLPAVMTNTLVTISIGTDPTRYPLVRRNCVQATACNIKTRTKYAICVATNTTSGVFRLLGDIGCCGAEVLASLPASTTTTTLDVASFNIAQTTKRVVAKKEVVENA